MYVNDRESRPRVYITCLAVGGCATIVIIVVPVPNDVHLLLLLLLLLMLMRLVAAYSIMR